MCSQDYPQGVKLCEGRGTRRGRGRRGAAPRVAAPRRGDDSDDDRWSYSFGSRIGPEAEYSRRPLQPETASCRRSPCKDSANAIPPSRGKRADIDRTGEKSARASRNIPQRAAGGAEDALGTPLCTVDYQVLSQ